MQLDPIGAGLESGADRLAPVRRVPVSDDVRLLAGLGANRSRKPVNTAAVKRSMNTVNHNAPREATAHMTLTCSRLPVTCTTGVRPFGAHDQPGGAASALLCQ
ncbi:hypothetical protein LNK82_45410 [Saccharothrix sp. NEAU-S10]|nr:hypothetical protein [Saccharothrix luteola]MCC8251506.1 hypothetical protein [Saccharothrix luteola]